MAEKGKRSNRLISEQSTYLREAAYQPVEWFPWCSEAFEKAKREGKPVLLDIGAAWCHWCHVMDEGTYENQKIAKIINEKFVAVKIDRDERPDVDSRYQKAVNAMTGQGGWPLTVFTDHEGRPFYGGTYFPPEPAGDLPGFDEVLERVYDYYTKNQADAAEIGQRVIASLKAEMERGGSAEMKHSVLKAAMHEMLGEADTINGGFGHMPKFPHAGAVEFLMASFSRGSTETLPVIVMTLNRMQSGGINDQLGGGFHRYSTDEKWIVPHFEKMSYDNAGLLRNYVHGYQLFRDEDYRRTARNTLYFLTTVLKGDNGFYASQDADSFPGDDGDYWTWTPSEAASVLGGREWEAASLYYHLHGRAEMHDRRDRHVLFRAMTTDSLAAQLSISPGKCAELIERANKLLLLEREKRPAPKVDRTVFANWNGMIISSIYEYSRTFGDTTIAATCRSFLEYALRHSFSADTGFAHVISRPCNSHGMLEDQVQSGLALLDAFCFHGDAVFLEAAISVADLLAGRYTTPSGLLSDRERGTSFDGNPSLSAIDNTPLFDAPNASPNAAAAIFFQRLEAITGRSIYLSHSEKILSAAMPYCAGTGSYSGSMFQAADLQINGVASVVVVGTPGDQRYDELLSAAGMLYLPGKELIAVDASASQHSMYSDTIRAMIEQTARKHRTFAFLCRGNSCSAPAGSETELLRAAGK
ncbi:MAG: thioredoxin domain-containing protein [Candidatus Thermoplasmatota archaeon]|nr:thioredoxin domain-containing protein [Candidatus Thermoplasmatota archaeon]